MLNRMIVKYMNQFLTFIAFTGPVTATCFNLLCFHRFAVH